jgi:hypothetical protein
MSSTGISKDNQGEVMGLPKNLSDSPPKIVRCNMRYPHGRFNAKLDMIIDTQCLSLGFDLLDGKGWFYLFENLPGTLTTVRPWLDDIYFNLGEGNMNIGEKNWQSMLTTVGKLYDEVQNNLLAMAKILEAQKKARRWF